jgi:hypothetical protein
VHSEDESKYYIKSQEDLYQLNEVVKFFWPGGATIIWFWQLAATGMCILGALILAPVTWIEQRHANKVNGVSKHLWLGMWQKNMVIEKVINKVAHLELDWENEGRASEARWTDGEQSEQAARGGESS